MYKNHCAQVIKHHIISRCDHHCHNNIKLLPVVIIIDIFLGNQSNRAVIALLGNVMFLKDFLRPE